MRHRFARAGALAPLQGRLGAAVLVAPNAEASGRTATRLNPTVGLAWAFD